MRVYCLSCSVTFWWWRQKSFLKAIGASADLLWFAILSSRKCACDSFTIITEIMWNYNYCACGSKIIRTFAGMKREMDLETCTFAVYEIARRAGTRAQKGQEPLRPGTFAPFSRRARERLISQFIAPHINRTWILANFHPILAKTGVLASMQATKGRAG